MKDYIVYVDGIEIGYIKAASHNSAEKKAQKRHVTPAKVQRLLRANTWLDEERARQRLAASVSVVYTEL